MASAEENNLTVFFGKKSSTGEKEKSYLQEIGYDENSYLSGQ